MHPAAQFIASRLPYLTHPGDDKHGPTALPLAMFRTTGLPEQMVEQVNEATKMTGEALVHTLESEYEIIPKADAAKLRLAAAAANEQLRHQQPRIHCQCGAFLFRLNVVDFNTDRPQVNGAQLIKAMQALSPECAVGHRNA